MTFQPIRRSLVFVAVGLSASFLPGWLLPMQASPRLATRSQSPQTRSQVIFEPPGDREPDNTAGGASRDGGRCPQDAAVESPAITPLTPATSQGLTVAEHPTIFVYVPETSAQTAFFSLRDREEDYYYQSTLPLPSTPGIVSVELPADAPALEVGKDYYWSFVTVCGTSLSVDDPRVEGQIQRLAATPDRLSQLEALSPLEQAVFYGADGIWYDTLTALAELERSQPDNASWNTFLESVGLAAIATEPLVNLP